MHEGDIWGPNGREDYLIAIDERDESDEEFLNRLIKEKEHLERHVADSKRLTVLKEKELQEIEIRINEVKGEV